jgi:hypothetical protein
MSLSRRGRLSNVVPNARPVRQEALHCSLCKVTSALCSLLSALSSLLSTLCVLLSLPSPLLSSRRIREGTVNSRSSSDATVHPSSYLSTHTTHTHTTHPLPHRPAFMPLLCASPHRPAFMPLLCASLVSLSFFSPAHLTSQHISVIIRPLSLCSFLGSSPLIPPLRLPAVWCVHV